MERAVQGMLASLCSETCSDEVWCHVYVSWCATSLINQFNCCTFNLLQVRYKGIVSRGVIFFDPSETNPVVTTIIITFTAIIIIDVVGVVVLSSLARRT